MLELGKERFPEAENDLSFLPSQTVLELGKERFPDAESEISLLKFNLRSVHESGAYPATDDEDHAGRYVRDLHPARREWRPAGEPGHRSRQDTLSEI